MIGGETVTMRAFTPKPSIRFAMLFCLLATGSSAAPIDGARAQAASPFAGLSGSWAGDGSVWLANGAFERLRCQATYAVGGGGDTLDQTLRCAGAQDSFEFRIALENDAGAILETGASSPARSRAAFPAVARTASSRRSCAAKPLPPT